MFKATRFVMRLFALPLVALSLVCAPVGAATFVVAPLSGDAGDSYLLSLSDPDAVAHARDLVAQGPAAGATIVFAEIAAGADGFNRDVLAPGEPLWDWHVTRFEGFGDFGIELVDGSPTLVQDDVVGWITNTRRGPEDPFGHIGFWNYTVVQELSPVPLPATLPLLAGGLAALGLWRRARA